VACALQNIVDGERKRSPEMRIEGGSRKIIIFAALLGAAVANLAACSRESPAETRVGRTEPARVSAPSAHEVALAQAEGAHGVTTERCDALSGDARRACRERADLDLERARAAAAQARDGGTARTP
jgi:hypothetical protein